MRVSRIERAAPVLLLALAAGCVPRTATAPEPARAATTTASRPIVAAGLEAVMGRSARALVELFGTPDLDVREGAGRKLQFLGPACVLDTYLYRPRAGGEPIVTHIDARLPDGRDIDRASCIAALSRRQQAR